MKNENITFEINNMQFEVKHVQQRFGNSFYGDEEETHLSMVTEYIVTTDDEVYSFRVDGELSAKEVYTDFCYNCLAFVLQNGGMKDIINSADDDADYGVILCEDDYLSGNRTDLRKFHNFFEMYTGGEIYTVISNWCKENTNPSIWISEFREIKALMANFSPEELEDIIEDNEGELEEGASLKEVLKRELNTNVYIGNAFSLQMLTSDAMISVEEIPEEDFNNVKNIAKSVVGHEDTANILGVEFNRESITLNKGDVLYVAQIVGGRLPEGATTLPEGFSFKYLKVAIQ